MCSTFWRKNHQLIASTSLWYNRSMLLSDPSLKLTKYRIEALHTLHLETVEDLLSYYPYRYEVLHTSDYATWKEGDNVTFEAELVSSIHQFRKGRLTISSFEVQAFDRVFKVSLFNRPWLKQIPEGTVLTIQGIYKPVNRITCIKYDTKPLAAHPSVTPVYATKESIKQKTIRDCISKVYEAVQNEIQDTIPEEYIHQYRLLRKNVALRMIHEPEKMEDVQRAVRTLKYEEFLKFFLAIQWMKATEVEGTYKPPRKIDDDAIDSCIAHLPFALTKGQSATLQQILQDMSSDRLMYRLIQGDVGCGKTVVAALSMYACFTAGYQSAILAPTEILAKQHKKSLESILPSNVRIEVLYSAMTALQKRTVLEEVQKGAIDILVGTHALLQDTVNFNHLGLVIIDEQQRFGVAQRKALRNKAQDVDFLLMSATPIPRTLASALYGDMDISTIETLPEGRKTPETVYVHENSFRSVLKDVNHLLDSGRQLYVICASIEKNEDYHARNVMDTANALTLQFPNYEVGVLHGKMSPEEKESVMKAFEANSIQILVSTTVVEVGVNVINATGMIIYDADRFGLSQLHQLRGRIQRGSEKGFCWLLSDSTEEKVKERLQVLVKSNDGFEISSEDLRLRGPGDILGTRQSGLPDFILGNVVQDTNIMVTARKDAEHILQNQYNPEYAAILEYASQKSTAYTD